MMYNPKELIYFGMKKIIVSLIVVLSTTISIAQLNNDSTNHLAFKGVPIDGTLDQYVTKMKKSGFTDKGTENGIAILEGNFASYKNCVVGASTLKQKDLVSKITVMFSDRDTWSSLSSNYVDLKEMLTEKYGNPTDCVEKFQSYSQPKDDESKMYEVKFDKCKYYTIYETEKGTIQLSIEHDGVMSCFVKLAYFDKINGETIKKEALNDL